MASSANLGRCTSPSSVNYLNSCWRVRNFIAAVVGLLALQRVGLERLSGHGVMLAIDVTPKRSRTSPSSSWAEFR